MNITSLLAEALHLFLYHRAMFIAPLIQAWRPSRKQALESLSGTARISAVLLEQIEASQADLSTATIQALATALRIPPAWRLDIPHSFNCLFKDSDEQDEPAPSQVVPVTDRILAGSRTDRSLYVLLTVLMQVGDPKLMWAAEMNLCSLVNQSRQATVR